MYQLCQTSTSADSGGRTRYGKSDVVLDVGRSGGSTDKMEDKRTIDEDGACGVEGVGRANEKICAVDAG